LEWQQQQQHENLPFQWLYPPKLELLRFKSHLNSNPTPDSNTSFQSLYPLSRNNHKVTLLVSYPRSGNTLLRTLLERTTGYVTGSDTRPDRSLSKELAEQHDLIGEGIVSSHRVLYVKTHYPERMGHQIYVGHAAIVVVRNPYDAIDSYWNMNATKSHTKSLIPEVYQQFSEMWMGLVKNEIHIWNKFLEYWLSEECPIPVLVVRFEDLIRNPSWELQRVLKFTIEQNNDDHFVDHCNEIQQQKHEHSTMQLSDFWMSRIQHCCNVSNNADALGSYQPRSGTSGVASIGKSLRTGHYNQEMLDYIHQVCAMNYSTNYLRRFGYDIPTQNFPNNFIDMEGDDNVTTFPMEATTTIKDCTKISSLRVNDGMPIRPINCQFGRSLQQWRHSVTNNDRDPLPTIDKK
jgi:hypothetical protein